MAYVKLCPVCGQKEVFYPDGRPLHNCVPDKNTLEPVPKHLKKPEQEKDSGQDEDNKLANV